jgi:DNA-binding CsgD family transcriptional regulator
MLRELRRSKPHRQMISSGVMAARRGAGLGKAEAMRDTSPVSGIRRKAAGADDALARPPDGLERLDVELDGQSYVVLSYPSPPLAALQGLSDLESSIARAVASGQTNREIATGRNRSVFTVQNQLARIYKKLGVTSRSELAALLAQRGAEQP